MSIARTERASLRKERYPETNENQAPTVLFLPESEVSLTTGATETVVLTDSSDSSDENDEPTITDTGSTCTLLTSNTMYSVERFTDDNTAFKYLTGFEGYEHFKMMLSVLGPAAYELSYSSKKLSVENELFLTLMKLRTAKDDYQLALDFGIDRSTVSRIFRVWINFMYFELTELDFWPDRDIINEHFPKNFQKMFPTTRVILDATEIFIERPKNCDAQKVTFSTYKHHNTLKTMIGISPRGLVTYISPSYGGSASDRQIIERSVLTQTDGLFEDGDSIMSDRGIMVQDLFSHRNITVVTPTTMKGKCQLDGKTVIKDRRIASKRIHVERIIGYAKGFKILKKTLPHSKVIFGSRITTVCFLLTNFRTNIVGIDA